MAREDTPGDLTDDDDELDCEMDVDARSGSRTGRRPSAKPPPAPSLSPLKVPKGISDEILSLFDFTAKPTDAASLARNRVSKVLGKKRPSDADDPAPAALGSGSTIARLLREKAEDEQREKKVARQTKTLRDMERSDEATAAIRQRQAGAEALGRKIDARAAEVEEAFAGEVMDETPYPSEVVRAFDDAAFIPSPEAPGAAPDPFAPPIDCPTPVPSDLAPFVDAAAKGAARRGADTTVARAEVLREIVARGWLADAFAAARRRASPDRPAILPEDPATAQWLFRVATDPASSRECALGARDALFAAAGYEPSGADACAVPIRCRTSSSSSAAAASSDARESFALSWRPTAEETAAAMAKLGVAAAWGAETDEATETGKKKAAKSTSKATSTARGSRARAAKAAAADGTFPTSGRDAASRAAVAALLRPPTGPLRPHVFAATQLVGVFHSARVAVPGSSDPSGDARALAAVAAMRLDPRAGALAPSLDFAGAAIVAAASANDETWAAFLAAAATALARVGPTHASRLAAVRWTPWAGARAQRLQDDAALIALRDLVPHILRAEGIEVEDEEEAIAAAGGNRKRMGAAAATEAATDAQAEAARALSPVRVGKDTTPDCAWALVTAIHLADMVLHAGAAAGGGDAAEDPRGPRTPGSAATAASSLNRAAGEFMSFLKNTKARIPRSNMTALSVAKNLAVAVYTRHQRAQQLRENKHDLEREEARDARGEKEEDEEDDEEDRL
jgi:hypothetical protein